MEAILDGVICAQCDKHTQAAYEVRHECDTDDEYQWMCPECIDRFEQLCRGNIIVNRTTHEEC